MDGALVSLPLRLLLRGQQWGRKGNRLEETVPERHMETSEEAPDKRALLQRVLLLLLLSLKSSDGPLIVSEVTPD